MGGAKTVDAKKYLQRPDDSQMFSILAQKQGIGNQYLQNQADLIKAQSQFVPQTQTFDTSRLSKEAAELGIENKIRSREIEELTDPEAARMRHEMGSRVAELTNMAATQNAMNDWAKKQGITSGFTGLGQGTIGRSAIYDASTEAGRQARLRNLALQQGYLAQTPAPVGGLDPASAIQAEMAARAANLQAMQRYQQNVLASSQGLQQSTTDWINQNLGELQQANNVAQQNKQNYEQAMYNNAVQNAASQNAISSAYLSAGGSIIGAGLGAMLGGPSRGGNLG
jgi:hypothetical protein